MRERPCGQHQQAEDPVAAAIRAIGRIARISRIGRFDPTGRIAGV